MNMHIHFVVVSLTPQSFNSAGFGLVKVPEGIQHVGGPTFSILADCVFYQEIKCWVNNDINFAYLCESKKNTYHLSGLIPLWLSHV